MISTGLGEIEGILMRVLGRAPAVVACVAILAGTAIGPAHAAGVDHRSAPGVVGVHLPALNPTFGRVVATSPSVDPAIQGQSVTSVVTPLSIGLRGKITRERPVELKAQGTVARAYSASNIKFGSPNSAKPTVTHITSKTWFQTLAVTEHRAATTADAERGFALIEEMLGPFGAVHRADTESARVLWTKQRTRWSGMLFAIVQRGERVTATIYNADGKSSKRRALPNHERVVAQTIAQNNAPAELLAAPPLGQEIANAVGQLGALMISTLTFRPYKLRGDFLNDFRLKRINYSKISTATAIRAMSDMKSGMVGLGDEVSLSVAGFTPGSPRVWVSAIDIPSGYQSCFSAPRKSHKIMKKRACPTDVVWTTTG